MGDTLAEGDGEARGVGEIRASLRKALIEALMDRPIAGKLIREAMLEYVMRNSPMLNSYIKGIARFTGLSDDEVRKSRPVREYVRKLLGF
jgi:hypothetical protein